jgi:hypothetical protein
MISLAFALALLAQDTPAAAPPSAEPPAAAEAPEASTPEDRLPTGAPKDDYQFVAWCYGALRGYLDMHDEVMPEVTRIEGQFRRPGSSLKDDLKVYADMQKNGRAQLKTFQAALTAAEKASLRPINTVGAEAVRQGHQIWDTAPGVSKARKAQEWMSWALPARCERVAGELETRAKLMAATLKANETTGASPDAAPTDAAPAEATQPPAAEPAPDESQPAEAAPAKTAPGLDEPTVDVSPDAPASEPPTP